MEDFVRVWYDDAATLLDVLRSLRDVGCKHMFQSVAVFPDEDGEISSELVSSLERAEISSRLATADILKNGAEDILGRTGSLRIRAMESLVPRIADFTYGAEKWTDVDFEGLHGGICVWPALDGLAGQTRQWANDIRRYWNDDQIGLFFDPKSMAVRECFESLQESCPFTDQKGELIRRRLILEKSLLNRDLRLSPAKVATGLLPRPNGTRPKRLIGNEECELWLKWEQAIFAFVDGENNGCQSCWDMHNVKLDKLAGVKNKIEFSRIHKRHRFLSINQK